MGFGSSPAGVGPAGFDPVKPLSGRPSQGAPIAAFVDARLRDVVVRADGIVAGTHPVDQEVVLAIIVARGTILAAPNTGSTLRAIEFGGPTLPTLVKDAVRLALATLVSNGDVAILAITEEDGNGGYRFALSYKNLRAGTTPTIPVL